MIKYWKSTAILLVTLFVSIVIFIITQQKGDNFTLVPPENSTGIFKGDRAPDFVGMTLSGDEIRLSDYKGKTVLVNVFASWCGPCRLEAPHLSEVYREYKDQEVVFIGLNLRESPDEVAEFQSEFGWDFPLVLNQNGNLTDIYKPLGVPTSWLIDPDGIIQYVHTGPVNTEMLIQAIDNIQNGIEI
jgi:thiol-disulfide isomerase/thioredoxin